MAAGPVGIAGGVLGGRFLPWIGSDLFSDSVDEGDDIAGFKVSCLCGKVLLSPPPLATDSQLSFRGEATIGVVCVVDDRFKEDRIGRGCISGFARKSDPNCFASL
jgi:hypothetical protein